MLEGESWRLATAPASSRPLWEPSRRRLSWKNGAQASVYSAEEPGQLRGSEHHLAWCDELAKWAHATEAWDKLQLGLRHDRKSAAEGTSRPVRVELGGTRNSQKKQEDNEEMVMVT